MGSRPRTDQNETRHIYALTVVLSFCVHTERYERTHTHTQTHARTHTHPHAELDPNALTAAARKEQSKGLTK